MKIVALCMVFINFLVSQGFSTEYLFTGPKQDNRSVYSLKITGKPELSLKLNPENGESIHKKIRNAEFLYFDAHFKAKGHKRQAIALSKLKSLKNMKRSIPITLVFEEKNEIIEYTFDRSIPRYPVDEFLIERMNYFEQQVAFIKRR